MEKVFIWSEQYEVGEPILDDQHKYLFDLGNEIQTADKSRANHYVMKLFRYTSAHFKIEEDHMKKIQYPGIANHRKRHDKLLSDLNAVSNDFSNDSFEEFQNFLYSWLVDHILNEDKKYFAFNQGTK
ncbi:MAG: hemerythrin family protein [Desulfobacula sp.]|nr:hemerythrin family protein [Desulfobacula sp.]